jgi:hypothetical protein
MAHPLCVPLCYAPLQALDDALYVLQLVTHLLLTTPELPSALTVPLFVYAACVHVW